MDNRKIFGFLLEKLEQKKQCVLVTVISVTGSSMRDPGAHMAVDEQGNFEGSLSGGCIENAVVSEARDALVTGSPRITRFGENSKYLDIKLPCGGGLDVHFQPLRDREMVQQVVDAIAQRQPFNLLLPLDAGHPSFQSGLSSNEVNPEAGTITIGHYPNPKLLIAGHGAAVLSLARQGNAIHTDVEILSSDPALVKEARDKGFEAHLLKTPTDCSAFKADIYTAIIFFFHDHEWEGALMKHALDQPHFYFGAMGGKKAHKRRVATLISLGVDVTAIEKIHAPIGLFHSSRDPDTLALSTLAQIMADYHTHDFVRY